MEDQLVLVVPAHHGWAEQETALEDLRLEPILMREFGSGTRRLIESSLTKAELKMKELMSGMELDSNEGLLNAVEAGLGYTVVSRMGDTQSTRSRNAKALEGQRVEAFTKFSMAYQGPEPVGNVGAFRGFLLAHRWNRESARSSVNPSSFCIPAMHRIVQEYR